MEKATVSMTFGTCILHAILPEGYDAERDLLATAKLLVVTLVMLRLCVPQNDPILLQVKTKMPRNGPSTVQFRSGLS